MGGGSNSRLGDRSHGRNSPSLPPSHQLSWDRSQGAIIIDIIIHQLKQQVSGASGLLHISGVREAHAVG